jgi:hypothetical protein
MDRDEALELLPPLYAVALRLVDAGAEPALIAAAEGIELESVPAFVELARVKLQAVDDQPPRRRSSS